MIYQFKKPLEAINLNRNNIGIPRNRAIATSENPYNGNGGFRFQIPIIRCNFVICKVNN